MDFNFDTIIYIVLGLIFVFAQVAKNKRKKARSQAPVNESDKAPEPPRTQSVLEQMLGIPEEKPIVEKPVENKQPHLVNPGPSFSQSGPRESVGNAVNEAVVKSPQEKINVSAGSYKMKSRKLANFNLKQAVIYKTILERKKY